MAFVRLLKVFRLSGCVMVARKILALVVGVRVLPGQRGPFVYRLGREILILQRGVRFP